MVIVSDPGDEVKPIEVKDRLSMEEKIKYECRMISDLLCKKNESYGDSACSPIQIFSKLDANEAICARIDDKLSRIANRGLNGDTEDTLFDLIGYLILLQIARKDAIKDSMNTKTKDLDPMGVGC